MAVGPQISAPAGLPWCQMGASGADNGMQAPVAQRPAMAAIVVGGQGGGGGAGPFDNGSGSGGQDDA